MSKILIFNKIDNFFVVGELLTQVLLVEKIPTTAR